MKKTTGKRKWLHHPPVVLVLWEDHHMGRTDTPRPLLVQTVGFLIYEDKRVIKVAFNFEEDGETCDDEEITLIRKCVIKTRVLLPANKG